MKSLLRASVLLATVFTASLPAMSQPQPKLYDVITVQVPFKFQLGVKAFPPGKYQFILVGTEMVAVRDEKKAFVSTLLTRNIGTGNAAPANKIVFEARKGRQELSEIWIEKDNQVLQVLQEDVAVRNVPQPWPAPASGFFFNWRDDRPRFRH